MALCRVAGAIVFDGHKPLACQGLEGHVNLTNSMSDVPRGFPWFMQALAYNFCHISCLDVPPSKLDG